MNLPAPDSVCPWPDLLALSPRLAMPALVRLSPSGVPPESVWTAIDRYLADPHGPPTGELRMFRDGAPVSIAAETLSDFRDDPRETAIFLNHAERWLGSMFAPLREWLRGLDGAFQPQLYEKELHLIAGAYSGTPFGAHIDSPLERSLHFNLGPGRKTFLLWPSETYIGLTGGTAPSRNIATLSPHAQRFPLAAGEALILPETFYHIAIDCEYCVTLAVTLRRRLPRRTAAAVLARGLAVLADSVAPVPDTFDAPATPVFRVEPQETTWSEPLANQAKSWYAEWRYEVNAASGFSDGPKK